MNENTIIEALQADTAHVSLAGDLIERIKRDANQPGGITATQAVPRRRPVWQWAAAAVLALAVAGVADWGLGTGAVAAVLKSLGVVQVVEMDATEVAEFEAANYDPDYYEKLPAPGEKVVDELGNVVRQASTKVTLAEAVQAVSYQLLQPTGFPEPDNVQLLDPGNPNSQVSLGYQQGRITITQVPTAGMVWIKLRAPEGATEDVTVGGEPAVIIRGAFVMEDDGSMKWHADRSATLSFERDGRHITIMAKNAAIPTRELIRIAESLE